MKLQVGSGRKIIPGWINMDLKRGDLRANITEGIPLKDSSIDLIFHEHFLEHLEYPVDANKFIQESYRVLKPGGYMRIGVPDTEYTIRAYLEGNEQYFKMCRELWHPDWCTTPMESVNFHFRQLGQHKFAYDYETVHKILLQNNFRNINKSSYKQSKVEELNVDTRDDAGTLWVECIK
ncbi:methyltransferase domain-containing protein [Candidatus Woesearchaeota archaeon]|nr:methyltransferase domain-containing protein [Candidatus Woesearchaeota archaeon]